MGVCRQCMDTGVTQQGHCCECLIAKHPVLQNKANEAYEKNKANKKKIDVIRDSYRNRVDILNDFNE